MSEEFDAIVIGSGPNGLAAAITLARAGLGVLVVEAWPTVGGSARSAELTLPGFVHDVCSAVHPLAAASPCFRALDLARYGLEFIHPDLALAHPLEDGQTAIMCRSIDETSRLLGIDGTAYARCFSPLAASAGNLLDDLLGPLPIPPRHPLALARFGRHAVQSALGWAHRHFQTDPARALFIGNAAHAWLPLDGWLTAAVGLMLHVTCHHAGWPIIRGGSQKLADALASCLKVSGGAIRTGVPVTSLAELPRARAILFDTGPRAMARIAAGRLPEGFRRRLERFRYGPAAWKIDLALEAPIPWSDEACRRAGTVHLGGSARAIAASESAIWHGHIPHQPFTLVAQPSLIDPTRAPAGRHTAWIYAHVPHACDTDVTDIILEQIEAFAPGFRSVIAARHVMSPADFERYNPNCVGGDIIGGVQDFRQMFTRPVARWNPYSTPAPDIFLCSASTPPGAGVHGMCGFHAARSALASVFGIR